jgi:hypothetical protein
MQEFSYRGKQMRIMSLLLTALLAVTGTPAQAQDSAGGTPYRVDSDASWIRVLAWPDGPLKRFGHHHVISHHSISGTVDVAPNPLDSSFQLELAVADLQVDDPELRALEGEEFEGEVPQKDIDGTRTNMLSEPLLHGEQFPMIRVESAAIEGSLPDATIVVNVVVKGTEQTVSFPASIELTDDRFMVRGQRDIMHGEFGLSPFTAMGGALSVRDLLVFKYEISGERIAD